MKALKYKFWAKCVAFFLLALVTVTLIASAVGAFYLLDENAFVGPVEKVVEDRLLSSLVQETMQIEWQLQECCETELAQVPRQAGVYRSEIIVPEESPYELLEEDPVPAVEGATAGPVTVIPEENENARTVQGDTAPVTDGLLFTDDQLLQFQQLVVSCYPPSQTNLTIFLYDSQGDLLAQNTKPLTESERAYSYEDTFSVTVNGVEGKLHICTSLPNARTARDTFYFIDHLYRPLVQARAIIIAVACVSLVLWFVLLIFLFCAAGCKEGVDGVHLTWFDRIPLDLLALAVFFLVCILLNCAGFGGSAMTELFVISACLCAAGVAALVALLTIAVRIKAGTLWKNTVIYRLISFLFGLHLLQKLWQGVGGILHILPIYWKAALAWGLSILIEIFLLEDNGISTGYCYLWSAEKAALTAVLAVALYNMHSLQVAGEKMAAGDLNYQVDLSRLHFGFAKHGKNLNSINYGIQQAVDQRTRSERLKTELITNVSHDIKTPLTSIINYADLLSKQPMPNAQAEEYLKVLQRQSARLKKLTEDLVEASKAATGNLSVHLEATDANVLLMQAVGEYQDKLEQAQLDPQLITDPAAPRIMADGKLLWRVFDNLLANICKYAMAGTRVYFTTQVQEASLEISFKNISAAPLNIPASELLERFVRGDASRSTEGSGLGLSIANSLTELQGGEFDLVTDGDLFKVLLRFPVLPKE